jgi:LacI family transcriptional regulator
MASQGPRVTLDDIAQELGLSAGTVSRALQDHPGINAMTKSKVLSVAKTLGYRPNLAARFLSSRRALRIAVNLPKESANFYALVRRGIEDEAEPFKMAGIELKHTVYPSLLEGELEAFEESLAEGVDGIILVPGAPQRLSSCFRRASRARVPVVCVVSDAPDAKKLASVSVNTESSGAIAAELMARFLGGKGQIAVSSGDLRIADHAQKYNAFTATMASLYPNVQVYPAVENHGLPSDAYDRVLTFLKSQAYLSGLYISTGYGAAPVLRAVEDAGLAGKLTVFATSLFEDLVPRIESGTVTGTLYERPYSQGRLALRLLREYLIDGKWPASRTQLAPLLIMKSNLGSYIRPAGNSSKQPVTWSETTAWASADELRQFEGEV